MQWGGEQVRVQLKGERQGLRLTEMRGLASSAEERGAGISLTAASDLKTPPSPSPPVCSTWVPRLTGASTLMTSPRSDYRVALQ